MSMTNQPQDMSQAADATMGHGYRVTGFPGRPVFQDVRGLAAGGADPTGGGVATLLQGVFATSDALTEWIASIHTNSVSPSTLLVDRLDRTGAVTRRWTLTNAVPTSLSGADMQTAGNEVAVESVEVAYETLVVSAP